MYFFLKQLVLPPLNLVALALLALMVRRWAPRLGSAVFAASLLALYAAGTPLLGGFLIEGLESSATDPTPETTAADARAIVILGAGLSTHAPEYGGATVGPETLQRLRYGARVHRETGLPVLVTGGTWLASPTPIAAVMKKVLEADLATPVAWMEDQSSNTFENATLSAAILRRQGIHTIYLVTHAFHMPRAREAFERAGLKIVPAPTGYFNRGTGTLAPLLPSAKGLRVTYLGMHELIGRAWYWLFYYGD